MKFRDRVAVFMNGRYGTDDLYRFLIWVAMSLTLAGWIFGMARLYAVMYVLVALGILILCYRFYRFLSKKTTARRKENAVYLRCRRAVLRFLRLQKNRVQDRKTNIYRACPQCRATLRLPKVKGEHTVVCPKCSHRFSVRV